MSPRATLILSAFALLVLAAIASLLIGGPTSAILVLVIGAVMALALLAFGGMPSSRSDQTTATAASAPSLFTNADFATVADASDDLIVGVQRGRVVFANQGARAMLGDHIVGSDVRLAIRHPAAADRLANPRARSSGGITDLSGFGRPGERWRLRTVALSDDSRLAILSDISALDAAEAMRSDFVANASHELRTPLASIIGAAETLEDDEVASDSNARARFTGIIGREGRRMQRLVDDLLSVSRIAADRHRTPDTKINLASIITTTLHEIGGGDDPRATDIVASGLDAPLMIAADAGQIGQLVHNLVGNAMKYGRAGTPVSVALDSNDDAMVQLTVSDQGDGIDSHHLPRLTERFYRVDNARSRSLGGTGLGLAIVKHIVERHRGRLDIASVPGEGTRVTVTLPRTI